MLTKNLKLMRRLFYTIVVIFLAFTACQKPIEEPRRFTQGMVVSARAEASAIGLSILKKGGNAFDAMIATDLALAVSYPNAGNIGGGGFMVYRLADGQVGSLDYREKAPAQSSSNMYLDSLGNVVPNKSTEGGLAVGVPGTVAGLFEVHEKFGSLPMRELIQPAIDLAKMGVVMTPKQFQRLNIYKDKIIELNAPDCFYNQSFAVEDTLQYHTLANTLQAIQSKGKNAFYQGTIAQEMVNYVSKKGGILSLDDLKNYKAVWRDPIRLQYKDLSIISMGPPSSGGIVLGQILKMIEPFALTQNDFLSPSSIQPIVEASRRAYADRSEYLGDPDFVAIPVEGLLDSEYLKKRMISFDWSQATASSSVASGKLTLQESPETTHYSIIDSKGNVVSNFELTDVGVYDKSGESVKVADFSKIETPGLYHYDGAYTGTQPIQNWYNIRTIEIGNSTRASQFVMPYNVDRIFYRRNTDPGWQGYVELYHTGNLPTIPTNNNQLTNGAGYITSFTNTVDMGDGFKIANSAGTDQFTVTENEEIRFAGSGATSVAFDAETQKVTISSTDNNTTYSVGDGGLTQKNFTTTLKNIQ